MFSKILYKLKNIKKMSTEEEKERIIKRARKYYATAEKYGDFITPELKEFLGEDFITAPASTLYGSINYSHAGGLIEYILNITKQMVSINTSLAENIRYDNEVLFKVALLHQIGKAKMFVYDDRNNKYGFNSALPIMSVGERSVYYALSNGVKLTEEVISAIISFDKTDEQSKSFNSEIGDILKAAILLSRVEDKLNIKK